METYRSKIGLEIVIFIGSIFGLVSFMAIRDHTWPAFIIMAAAVVLCIYLLTSIKYRIINKDLVINCGFSISTKIRIEEIKKIKETYNPLSSPAASIDRIAVYYSRSGYVLLSPKRKMEFIRRLQEINPKIEVKLRKSL